MYNLKYTRTDGDFIGISESLKGQVNMLFKATSALNKHRVSIYKMKWHVESKVQSMDFTKTKQCHHSGLLLRFNIM